MNLFLGIVLYFLIGLLSGFVLYRKDPLADELPLVLSVLIWPIILLGLGIVYLADFNIECSVKKKGFK